MDTAHLTPQEIDAIAVSNGPGSYTGLRIGLSVAKGMCYALNTPLLQISTLQALAGGMRAMANDTNALYCPMIDARRMEVYVSAFDHTLEERVAARSWILDPAFFPGIDAFPTVYIAGNGAAKAQEILTGNKFHYQDVTTSATLLIEIGLRKFYSEAFQNIAYAKPFYFKPPNITQSRKNM